MEIGEIITMLARPLRFTYNNEKRMETIIP